MCETGPLAHFLDRHVSESLHLYAECASYLFQSRAKLGVRRAELDDLVRLARYGAFQWNAKEADRNIQRPAIFHNEWAIVAQSTANRFQFCPGLARSQHKGGAFLFQSFQRGAGC